MWGHRSEGAPLRSREGELAQDAGVQISNRGFSCQSRDLKVLLNVRCCRQSLNVESISNNPSFSFNVDLVIAKPP